MNKRCDKWNLSN